MAYFSPELREDEFIWKPRDTYSDDCNFVFGQNMGTTQIGVQALRYADYFLKGKFSNAATKYVDATAQPLAVVIK